MSTCLIDSDKLIKAVKERPCLYNKNDSHYQLQSNRSYKEKMWRECCEIVFKDWASLKPQEKLEHNIELKRRWRSLRTCFVRELALIKAEEEKQRNSATPIQRKRRYRYYKKLTFLLGDQQDESEARENYEDNESTRDSSESDNNFLEVDYKMETYDEHDNEEREIDISEISEQSEVKPIRINVNKSIASKEQNKQSTHNTESTESKLLDMLKEKMENECDEDRQFLLSLVPMFKKIKGKQKLQARIELLSMIQKFTYVE